MAWPRRTVASWFVENKDYWKYFLVHILIHIITPLNLVTRFSPGFLFLKAPPLPFLVSIPIPLEAPPVFTWVPLVPDTRVWEGSTTSWAFAVWSSFMTNVENEGFWWWEAFPFIDWWITCWWSLLIFFYIPFYEVI